MAVLPQEMARSAATGPQPVFVMKVLPGLAPGRRRDHEFIVQLVSAWHGTSWIEIVAAALAVAYLLLAIRQQIGCWAAAFVSSCLYVWVLFGARLYMESVLNAFYAAMAVYGFWQWRQARRRRRWKCRAGRCRAICWGWPAVIGTVDGQQLFPAAASLLPHGPSWIPW